MRRLLLVAGAVVLLSGCGGGGGSPAPFVPAVQISLTIAPAYGQDPTNSSTYDPINQITVWLDNTVLVSSSLLPVTGQTTPPTPGTYIVNSAGAGLTPGVHTITITSASSGEWSPAVQTTYPFSLVITAASPVTFGGAAQPQPVTGTTIGPDSVHSLILLNQPTQMSFYTITVP